MDVIAEPFDSAPSGDFVTSREACGILGIKPATLYTYVSRGLLHPVAESGRKVHLYLREEVEDLRSRSEARMGHGAVAAMALRWGQPVIDTAITEISPQGPRYRGRLAADLAQHPGAFENVAELLWSGTLADAPVLWRAPAGGADIQAALDGIGLHDPPSMARVFSVACIALAGHAPSPVWPGDARQLLQVFAGCCGVLGPDGRYRAPAGRLPLARRIAGALGVAPAPGLLRMIDTALILCADHELSPPTFSARVAASVGADLHACVTAALAAHSGGGLAGGCDLLEDMLADATSPARFKRWVATALHDRTRLPGFGLASYPQGDPRAALLLEMARSHPAPTRRAERLFRFVDEVRTRVGIAPRIEVGLAAVCAAWGLPPRSAGALWAIGRTAGWAAHVAEQRGHGFFLRPRGQFRSPAAYGVES